MANKAQERVLTTLHQAPPPALGLAFPLAAPEVSILGLEEVAGKDHGDLLGTSSALGVAATADTVEDTASITTDQALPDRTRRAGIRKATTLTWRILPIL